MCTGNADFARQTRQSQPRENKRCWSVLSLMLWHFLVTRWDKIVMQALGLLSFTCWANSPWCSFPSHMPWWDVGCQDTATQAPQSRRLCWQSSRNQSSAGNAHISSLHRECWSISLLPWIPGLSSVPALLLHLLTSGKLIFEGHIETVW